MGSEMCIRDRVRKGLVAPKLTKVGPKMGQDRTNMGPGEFQEYLAEFDCRAAHLLGRVPSARAIVYAHIGRRPKMAHDGPEMGCKWPREALIKSGGVVRPSRGILGTLLGPSWAHLGLSWAFLGPSWGVPGGIWRQILGLGGQWLA